MVSETFSPPFPTSPFIEVSLYGNENVPNFPTYRGSPFIETPLMEVPLYCETNTYNRRIRCNVVILNIEIMLS